MPYLILVNLSLENVGSPFNSHIGWNIFWDLLYGTHFIMLDYGPKDRNTTKKYMNDMPSIFTNLE